MSVRLFPLVVACAVSASAGCSKNPSAPNAHVAADAAIRLTVTNPSQQPRLDAPYWLALTDLGQTASAWRAQLASGEAVPTELVDRDGDGQLDHLLLVFPKVDSTLTVTLVPEASPSALAKRTHAEISQKTGGRWQGRVYQGGEFQSVTELTPPPEHTDHSEFIRYEGPGIESDKVAYRIYLDWRNGFDIFGNVTGAPVLKQVGLDGYDSYHAMQAWGLDLLKVGNSLGVGGFGYWDGKQVQGVHQVSQHQARILADGALYSSVQINYRGWHLPTSQVPDSKAPGASRAVAIAPHVPERDLDVQAQFESLAGSRLIHTKLELRAKDQPFSHQPQQLDKLAIGLTKHPAAEVLQGTLESSGHQFTYLANWGQQSLNQDDLGMAILVKRGSVEKFTEDEHSLVAVVKPAGNQLDYYFLAAWSKEPAGITSKQAFIAYLQQQADALTMPLRGQLDTPTTRAQTQQPLTSERALWWAEQMANSELHRQAGQYYWGGWDLERQRPVSFEYTTGLLLQAFADLNQQRANPAYQAAIDKMVDTFVSPDGNIHSYELAKYNIDSLNSGNLLLRAYQGESAHAGEPRLRQALASLRAQYLTHPKTQNGAFWHKLMYPSQVWLDGVYMGMPFLARYGIAFEQGEPLAQVVHEFEVVQQQLKDPRSGLYYHGWDESKTAPWADANTGLSSQFWSRGMGWLAMALVDVLEVIPADQPELRAPLLQMSQELAKALVQVQDPSGMWWNITNQPNRVGNYLESSSSAMFVYFFAKGSRLGIFGSEQSYQQVAVRGFQGLLNHSIVIDAKQQSHLWHLIQVAGLSNGRDGSYGYYQAEPMYQNDSKGTGPFIMAAVQLSQLLR